MYRDCRSCYRTYLLKSSNYHEQFCSLAVACAACKWKVPPLIPRRSIIFESLYTQGQGAYLRGIRVGTEKNIKIITSTEQEYHVDQVVNVLLTLSWISQVRFLLEAICIFSFYFEFVKLRILRGFCFFCYQFNIFEFRQKASKRIELFLVFDWFYFICDW